MKKLILSTVVFIVACIASFSTAYASTPTRVMLDGEFIDTQAVIIGGTTLLPVRFISEALGATVLWDGELQQVTVQHGGTVILMTINSSNASINGVAATLARPPQLIGGSTNVPLRFIAEALGLHVDFVDGVVVLTSPLQAVPLPIEVDDDVENDEPHDYEDEHDEAEPPTDIAVLFSGTFTVGQDILPGRYVITADSSGNFVIRTADGRLWVNEILNDGTGALGVPSVTVDIGLDYEIEIRGINNVTFAPAINELSTLLTTGRWVVGVHIPAGTFDARPTIDGDSGNFVIHNADGRLAVNEILRDRVRVNLHNGQTINIAGLTSVTFDSP